MVVEVLVVAVFVLVGVVVVGVLVPVPPDDPPPPPPEGGGVGGISPPDDPPVVIEMAELFVPPKISVTRTVIVYSVLEDRPLKVWLNSPVPD